MAYSKQTWDTTSYVNPTRMNHIEDGISKCEWKTKTVTVTTTATGTVTLNDNNILLTEYVTSSQKSNFYCVKYDNFNYGLFGYNTPHYPLANTEITFTYAYLTT